ncbi:MAG: ammonia-forming cytochrome c nitrite reductase subunit c552 [Actinobacteria bacterium]|nr:MAG: ammonia-forming cytochrome c nitrite reductase subunit c552 [Actinomycetota bacterium]
MGTSRDRRKRIVVTAAVALLFAALLLAGCYGTLDVPSELEAQVRGACGGADCHDEVIEAAEAGPHADAGCVICHEGADKEHAATPDKVEAATDWRIASCAECHEGQAATYLYDDNAKAGPYGGSVRVPATPKKATFARYSTIASGHAFVKDYNEEGAHKWMFADHRAITRGKFETCMQCKSTKIAWSWTNSKPLTVASDTDVELTHTKTPTTPAKTVKIPKGTVLTYATDAKTAEVDAKATLPDGTVYTSRPKASEDATKNFNMLWAATVAATKETMPYGAGCNHCHDPHSGEPRLVRGAMLTAIESGGPDGEGGLNPYGTGQQRAKTLADGTAQDVTNSQCGQCHVEYTCGKSGVDGKDRDVFGWGKARDLHEMYSAKYDYKQDWKQKIIGEPLIKSQHPELELYWNSPHYTVGASCADCHMPEVRGADGEVFRSHWLTSPYKYEDAKLYAAFAAKTGLDATYVDKPCARCHEDKKAEGVAIQHRVFAAQQRAETALAGSVAALGRVKTAKAAGTKVDEKAYAEALDKHRRAHVLWENLIVSENSMGFHNPPEVLAAMAESEKLAKEAAAGATAALK